MHIIQYILNLGQNTNFNSSGKIKLIGNADIIFEIFKIKSILKFKPDDIAYDLNGIEWRIISVSSNNNVYLYEAFNGTEVLTFGNLDLYNAAEINEIYQNGLECKIQAIVNKIKELEKYTENIELSETKKEVKAPRVFRKRVFDTTNSNTKKSKEKIKKGDICLDKKNNEWKITDIFEFNNKPKYQAFRKGTTKIFNEKDLKKI